MSLSTATPRSTSVRRLAPLLALLAVAGACKSRGSAEEFAGPYLTPRQFTNQFVAALERAEPEAIVTSAPDLLVLVRIPSTPDPAGYSVPLSEAYAAYCAAPLRLDEVLAAEVTRARGLLAGTITPAGLPVAPR